MAYRGLSAFMSMSFKPNLCWDFLMRVKYGDIWETFPQEVVVVLLTGLCWLVL